MGGCTYGRVHIWEGAQMGGSTHILRISLMGRCAQTGRVCTHMYVVVTGRKQTLVYGGL